jgi:Transposase IS116/IS110/IS902 family
VPSEHSSGQKQRKGGITKAGSPAMRVVFVQAAWAAIRPPQPAPSQRSDGPLGTSSHATARQQDRRSGSGPQACGDPVCHLARRDSLRRCAGCGEQGAPRPAAAPGSMPGPTPLTPPRTEHGLSQGGRPEARPFSEASAVDADPSCPSGADRGSWREAWPLASSHDCELRRYDCGAPTDRHPCADRSTSRPRSSRARIVD